MGDVTVVVASRNRCQQLLHTVGRLVDLSEQPPVVVVDDGSTDGSADAVRARFPQVAVVEQPHRGVTAARTAGVRRAETPYVAFADDDSWWAPGALRRIAGHFDAHPALGLIAARVLVGAEQALDPVSAAMADSPLPSTGLPGPRVLGFVACGSAVRRTAYLAVGGFCDRYIIGGEERDLALALAGAGWDVAYVEDVVAHHHPAAADRPGRTRRVVRNDLWTAWRNRRLPGAVAETWRITRDAGVDGARGGIGDAVRALPWALRTRRPVPAEVERQRRMLDDGVPASWVGPAARRRRSRMRARIIHHHVPAAGPAHDAPVPDASWRPSHPARPAVAVAVITHDRVAELCATIERLRELPERPHVVVVDNASTDGTAATVRERFHDVELVVLDRNAGAEARNVAVELLDWVDAIAFADDDTWWAPGALSRAAEVLAEHPAVAVVTARILVSPGGGEDPIVADMRDSPLPHDGLPGRPLVSILAGASMVRRSAFRQVGGFEPRLWLGGEEELLATDLLAAGWGLRFIPELTVHHAASPLRDHHRRRCDGLRNTLWVTWLRRPVGPATWRSWTILRGAPHDRITARAVLRAVIGLPWVLRERRRLPAAVERQMQLMDRVQLCSPARSYVS